MDLFFLVPLTGLFSMLIVWILARQVCNEDAGTKTHDAAIIGDVLGDPLKDAAGPSLHILVKLQNIFSITLLPLFLAHALLFVNV